MSEMVTVHEQKLDKDAIDVLRCLDEHGELTTSEVQSRLNHKNNDYTRRRFEWLENANLVALKKVPWSKNDEISVTEASITEDGKEFLESWNFEGIGEGLPVEERVRRLEDRVEELESENQHLRDGFVAMERYLEQEVNVDLNEFLPEE
ncbi:MULTISPECIES: hypothetical protein [Halorussus]|uniref:Uncharacterized protein n=2 Tax=Halorussus TaxID=1070314 RepID=A0A8U0HV25_9EURY|nr:MULTISPECIES: hypothetical protein [Halorussus]UPV74591.1 hypothetical protein M0R89_00635 [Halorussus limi]